MKPLHVHILLSTFNHLAYNGSRMAVTLYAVYLQASPGLIGLVTASFGMVSMFTAVHMGRWIDRAGPRTPMMLASLMMVASGVLAAASRSVWPLFLACPVMGMFNSTFQIATQQTVGRYGSPSDRANNFALQSLGISAATFAGPLVAGLAIDHLGHSSAFLLLACSGFIPLPVIGMRLLHFPPTPPKKRDASAGSPGGWKVLRDKPLRAAYIVATLNNAVWSVVSFMIPIYGAQIGMSATRIGTLMASLSAGVVAIRVLMPFLTRHFRQWPLVIVSQAALAAGFLVMPFTSIYALLVATAVVMGLGLGLAGPVSTALMYDASPPDKVAEVVGLRMTMANVAQTLVPLLAGGVGNAFGVGPVFWTVTAVVFWDVWSNREKLVRK